MDQLLPYLLKKRSELKTLISGIRKALLAAPEGRLRVSKSNGTYQFYRILEKNDTRGRYITKEMAKNLAQKELNQRTLKQAEEMLKALKLFTVRYEQFLDFVDNPPLHPVKAALVTPVIIPDELYVKHWLDRKWNPLSFEKETSEHYSANGRRVRSKSEALIMDVLDNLKIPYLYEYPLRATGYTVHPDFICLNVRTRCEYIWEHLGLMENSVYAKKAVAKLHEYALAGIFPILTCETLEKPLNTRIIQAVIRKYLL